MAAALALLIILPATAAEGLVDFRDVAETSAAKVVDPSGSNFTTDDGLLASVDYATATAAQTKISEERTYVSNISSGYNLVIFQVGRPLPADAPATVEVRPSGGARKNIAAASGVGYFRVVAQEASVSDFVADDSSYDGVYSGVHEVALAVANAVDGQVLDAANTVDGDKYEGVTESSDTVDTDEGWNAFRAVLNGDSSTFTVTSAAASALNITVGTVTVPVSEEVGTTNTEVTVNYDDPSTVDTDERVDLLGGIRAREIEAADGVSITIDGNVTIYVDGRTPEISIVSPTDGDLLDSDRVDFELTVTDDGSGLRSDRERPASGDDRDTDGVSKEPLAGQYGYGKDIGVFLADNDDKEFGTTVPSLDTAIADALRVDNRGDDDWDEEEQDHSYSVDFRTSTLDGGDGTYEWFILATDRVGNEARYPSDTEKFAKVTVDENGPDVEEGHVFAGIGFDDSKNEEVRDSSSIAIVFENESAHGLNTDTIESDAFKVEDNDVVDVIHPNNKKSLNNDKTKCTSDKGIVLVAADEVEKCIDTRNRVYLVLATALDDDEKPEVQVSSSQFTDRAGNGNEDVEQDAKDYIRPTLTVTATGDVSTDGRPLAGDKVTVTVAVGELLRSRPQAWLATVDANGNIADVSSAKSLGTVSGETTAWESEFDAGDFGLSGGQGLGAVIVSAKDRAQPSNESFTSGWKGKGSSPEDGDVLDLAKLVKAGLLVEFDNDLPEADIEVTPNKGNNFETESTNPFIKLTFGEGAEYTSVTIPGVAEDEGTEEKEFVADIIGGNSVTQGSGTSEVKTDVDSYEMVEITSITLDGVDVSARLASIDDGEFNLSLRDLVIGDHTIEYNAKDTAGNTTGAVEVDFKVNDRSKYAVDLSPGWNLVSIPANPDDPAIDAVLPADHPASSVLSYQNSEWVAANRPKLADRTAETSAWAGTLTDIVAGYGYFIETDAFNDLATLIPEANPTTPLPTVPVVSGWNLLGVVDVDQGDSKVSRRADVYLASISWSVAYGFNTATNRWQKIVVAPEAANINSEGKRVITAAAADVEAVLASKASPEYSVMNGAGYWVWATKKGTLVP